MDWLKNNFKLLVLSLGHMITDLNQGAMALVAVFLKDRFELSYFAVGIIILMSNASSSLVQPFFGAMSDRFNTLWMMPLGCLLAGLGLALAGLAPTFPLALICIFLSGLGVAAFHPDGSKSANHVSGERKSSAMSIFSVGGNLGFGLGPILAAFAYGIWGLTGMTLFLLPVSLTVLLLFYMLPHYQRASLVSKEQTGLKAEASAQKTVWGPLTTLVALIAVRSWVHLGLATFIPLYVVDVLHQSKDQGASLLGIFLIAGAVGTLLGGQLADRFGAYKVVFMSMILTAPLLWLIPHSQGLLLEIVLFLTGAILVSTFSPTIVLGQQMAPNRIGLVSGLMIGFAMGMGGIGATVLGKAADHIGILAILQGLFILPLLGAALTLLLVYGWRTNQEKIKTSTV